MCSSRVLIVGSVLALFLPSTAAEVLHPGSAFRRLPFNTPGTVEVGCGYLSQATPVDADGDGDWDLAVSGNGAGGGAMYYENPGDAAKTGVFKRGVRGKDVCAGWRFAMRTDGGYALTAPDRIVRSRADHAPGPVLPLGVGTENVHWGKVRCNSWLSKDYDGDGRDDVLVGIGDWREYGWHQNYDGIRQAWTNGRSRGLVYLLKDLARTGEPKWAEPRLVRIENGEPVETMGNPHPMLEDWDGDGDLDLILADFPGNYTYFENVGTRTKPVYTSGRLLHDSTGALFAADECIPVPQAIDWDGDGRLDILAAEEDSRVGFCRNTGRFEKGLPVFDPPVFLRAERDDLRFGILVSPHVCDFDGDGDQDIVVGDAAGYLAWFENLSGPGVAQPKWEGPHYLSCAAPSDAYVDVTIRPDTFEHAPFKHRAGHNGSIQGPVEAGFGYTCESVADWDGDGDLDIIYNHTWGKPMLLENVGTRTRPKFAAPRGIEVEWGAGGQPELKWAWLTPKRTGNPKEIVTQWRTTPVMIDLNGDGLMDLVMADTEGYLAYFERFRGARGELRLKAPRRAFIDAATGKPMGITGWGEGNGRDTGGHAGRRKICFADWDGDGRLDLLMNGSRNVVLWKQIRAADGAWSFRREGELTDQKLAAHSTCPAACDFDGDGVADLVLGVEDGYLYHLRNPRSLDAGEQREIWPEGKMPGESAAAEERMVRTAPNRLLFYDVSRPTLTHYRAKKGDGLRPAVLICPGGGYEFVSWINEGTEIANWFASRGFEAFILKYRVPNNRDGALADAQRAISLIRAKAGSWGIDAKKIGQIGFSAGANLTARTATHHDKRIYGAIDAIDAESCRPDFSVLVYPWTLVVGENSERELPLELRDDFPVTETTPPVFIVQTEDDFAHVENALAYYAACKRAKVPAEMHLYAKGGHGYGMRPGPQSEGWQDLMAIWLNRLLNR